MTNEKDWLRHSTVQLTLIAAGLDRLVSCLLDVAEELKRILDEATAADEPDE